MPQQGTPAHGTRQLDPQAVGAAPMRIVYEDPERCMGICESLLFTIEDATPTLPYLDE
ncbi:MAG TPA: hypothetical protein VK524_17630 [Polyangiaceae bacterium]|nr:hypothetical protein [Polyangiaceae bacterium]